MSLTDSDHGLPIAPNRLLHHPEAAQPDAVWVADITYVDTDEGWLYVAGVADWFGVNFTYDGYCGPFWQPLPQTLPKRMVGLGLTWRCHTPSTPR